MVGLILRLILCKVSNVVELVFKSQERCIRIVFRYTPIKTHFSFRAEKLKNSKCRCEVFNLKASAEPVVDVEFSLSVLVKKAATVGKVSNAVSVRLFIKTEPRLVGDLQWLVDHTSSSQASSWA